MDDFIKFSAQTAGKDKLARLIQYASKLLAFIVEKLKFRVELADQLKHLEFHFGTFRKLLRFGKSIEVLYSTLKTMHIPDAVLRSLLVLAKIAQSLFLLADHLIWLGRVGLLKIKDSERLNRIYNQCWLYSITLCLLRDIYEIRMSLRHYNGNNTLTTLGRGPRSSNALYALAPAYVQTVMLPYAYDLMGYCHDHKHITFDTLKNVCDFFIPLSNLGSFKISPGLIGILGIVSSLAGIVPMMDPSAKMSP